jgi:hypothetical protein
MLDDKAGHPATKCAVPTLTAGTGSAGPWFT